MKELGRRLGKVFGLIPIGVDLMTDVLGPLRPPGLDDEFRTVAIVASAVALVVTMIATWQPAAQGSRRRVIVAVALAVLLGCAFALFRGLMIHYPGANTTVDLAQEALWGVIFASFTALLALVVDVLMS